MSPSLRDFIQANHQLIIEKAQRRVSHRSPGHTASTALGRGIPLFLTQLGQMLTLHADRVHPESEDERGQQLIASAALYGEEQLRNGFSVAQVVHGYGDVCQVVTELANDAGVTIETGEFQIFNRFLDDAIAGAVTAYGTRREQDLAYEGTERMGVLAHELRNLLNTAVLSFDIIKKGVVGLSGSTSAIHSRSLAGLRGLVERSFAEVRLDAGVPRLERIELAEFIEEVQVSAAMEAEGKNVRFDVRPVEREVRIEVDRQLLASAVTNLLQNAFKFSRTRGLVTLDTRVTASSVFVDVSDECGGLPAGKAQALFEPFKRSGKDKSGLGLGLSIAERAIRANSGEIRVRDVPGTGCVFSIELPRQAGEDPTFHVLPTGDGGAATGDLSHR